MKTILALVLAMFMSGTVPPSLQTAIDLYVPVACTSPEVFRAKIGSAFPVGPHELMTAQHIDCKEIFGEMAVTEISDDRGIHWVVIDPAMNFPHPTIDVRIMVLPKVTFIHIAKFRAAELGENVVGYGLGFGESATFGHVIRLEGEKDPYHLIYASNTGIGGQSGSALVGDDGAVVGMVIIAAGTQVSDFVSSWVSGGFNGDFLEKLVKGFEESGLVQG